MSIEDTNKFESREQIAESLLQQRDLSGADLSGLDLSGIKLTGIKMQNANLSETNLNKAVLAGSGTPIPSWMRIRQPIATRRNPLQS